MAAAQKPRVLLLFSSSQLGGAERSLTRMALSSDGIDYRLATLDSDGPWSAWVRAQGQAPFVFGRTLRRSHSRMTIGALSHLVRAVRCESFDAIYVCGLRAASVLRPLRAVMPGVKLVHGVRWNPASDKTLDKAFRLIELVSHSLVDAWITNAAVTKSTLVSRCRIPEGRVHVIYNGVNGIPDDVTPFARRPFEVLTVANLNPRKGHTNLLRAIPLVRAKVPDVQFVFVGRDDMNGEVQAAIRQMGLDGVVRYEGFKEDVSSWLGRARVFVLPSLWGEGCPTSILEAMSWAIPVVATNIDGIPELIADGRDGYLVNPNDIQTMATRIAEFLICGEPYGEAGRDKVLREYRIAVSAEKHRAIFESLCRL